MKHHKGKVETVKTIADSDMIQEFGTLIPDSVTVSHPVDVPPVDVPPVDVPAVPPVDVPAVPASQIAVDFFLLFIETALSLLSAGQLSQIPVDVILSAMLERKLFTFPVPANGERIPKGKAFRICGTEKLAGSLYKKLVGELRNKSTVILPNGNFLYYSENMVRISQKLPVESLNAWKEALKLGAKASGK